jgi:hypothetical protein
MQVWFRSAGLELALDDAKVRCELRIVSAY